MKNWKSKKLFKILSTVTALVIIAVVLVVSIHSTTTEVQARTNVLKKITDGYQSKNSFKILEIVPTNDNDANEEIGYFMRGNQQEQMSDYFDVSKARSIGSMQEANGAGLQNLLTMRDYGLIKEANQDAAKYGMTSDNPIYSDYATFAYNGKSGYTKVGQQLVYGNYIFSNNNNGAYRLKDGYTIDDKGIIYSATVSQNTVPSVSGNGMRRQANRNSLPAAKELKTLNNKMLTEIGEVASNDEGEVFFIEEEDDEPDGKQENDSDPIKNPNTDIPGTNIGDDIIPAVNDTEIEADSSNVDRSGAMYSGDTGATYTDFLPVPVGDPFNKALPDGVEQAPKNDGNLRFETDDAGIYFGYEAKELYYYNGGNNKFRNGNWFNEFVFGDSAKNMSYTIDTRAASQVTVSDMSNYDLIYISGTKDTFAAASEDISADAAIALYNRVIDKYQAVIMDYALLDNQTLQDSITAGTCTNIEKLSLLLWQNNQKDLVTDANGFEVDEEDGVTTELKNWDNAAIEGWLALSHSSNISGGYGNFVAGSVYVYNHKMQYFKGSKAQIDAKDFFGTGDFNVPYNDSVVVNGFASVEYMVKMHNTNNPTARMTEAVTPAVVVQYILTYDGTEGSLIKSEISVLEIQPCRDFSYNTAYGSESYEELKNSSNAYALTAINNRKEFIKNCLGEPFYKDDKVDETSAAMVIFTSMTIDEFICRNEKLAEVYDVIYIGSNSSKNSAYPGTATGQYYKTTNRGRTDSSQPREITDFKDNRMDGMVYYNIGDTVNVAQYSSEQGTLGERASLWGTISNEDGTFRYAARDLTRDKKIALLNYLKTGYPIIVSGDLMQTNADTGLKQINPTKYSETSNLDSDGFDHGRIDNSSVMYEFFEVAIGRVTINTDVAENSNYSAAGYENLISIADLEKNEGTVGKVYKDAVSQAINQPKLVLSITSKPTEYEYITDTNDAITSMTTLSKGSNGKYNLEYEFTIDNISTGSKESDIYNAHLYIDINADGKFSETEELDGAIITNALTGEEITYVPTITGNAYSLTTNVLYKMTREVPDGYQGALPWCLSVSLVSNENISASVTGYTAIKESETTAVPIKILQIMNESGNNLNLQSSINTGTDNFGIYINKLKDLNMFDLQVTSINLNDYRNNVAYSNNLESYDMLILGFSDNYRDIVVSGTATQYAAMEALEKYIASGKPVLLTHDFMAHYPKYTVVQRMRSLTGMDRYGATNKTNYPEISAGVNYSKSLMQDAAIIQKIEASGNRVAYMPNSSKNTVIKHTQGLTNAILTRYNTLNRSSTKTDQRYIYADSVQGWNGHIDGYFNVVKVNDGQITNYPYKLPEVFTVSRTHQQYFQLDMETDQDKDGSSDIVVWYTLGYNSGETKYSNSAYNVTPKDGVNNYFIYNCGNITYTGSGHSGDLPTNSKYEAQLFINTMVAAYKAGVRAPSIGIYESSDVTSNKISNIAVPYDAAIGTNATETNAAESSLIQNADGTYKYQFVNHTSDSATKTWFRISDPNLVKGTKTVAVRYLIQVPAPADESNPDTGLEKITLASGEEVWVREVNMPIYNTDFSEEYDYNTYKTDLKSGTMYGMKLPMNLLKEDSGVLKKSGAFTIYVEAQTSIQSVSITGNVTIVKSNPAYASLSITKMDLLLLD